MQRVDHALAEGFQRGFGEAGADIDALGVLGGEDMAVGRGNADPPLLSSDPMTVEMNGWTNPVMLAMPPLIPSRPVGRSVGRCSGGLQHPWDGMG